MPHTITPGALQSLMDEGAAITLLDVRRVEDRNNDPTIIPGAVWLDPAALEDWSGERHYSRPSLTVF